VEGGANGFIAGRSLWKEAVALPAPERRRFLEDTGRRRMADMLGILDAAA
jgi:tagatose-1,6-bisphosphate aldolase